MPISDPRYYLEPVRQALRCQWPDNRAVNIVCHGHSVPAGYFDTPRVDARHAYPHLLRLALWERYPCAVINVIVTAVGGENSIEGAVRMDDVLGHGPDVITLDYGLNDRRADPRAVDAAWRSMIEGALLADARVLLLTPTWDNAERDAREEGGSSLAERAEHIRALAEEYAVGLCDSFAAFERACRVLHIGELLSWPNHPNARGHRIVADEIMRFF